MKVTAQFFDRSLAPAWGDDVEHFDTIKEARDSFWSRCDFDPMYPCVDPEGAEMLLWYGTLYDVTDLYPDFRFTMGPRGGVVREVT